MGIRRVIVTCPDGRMLDATLEDTRAVLGQWADAAALKGRWVQWEMLNTALTVGEQVQKERSLRLSRMIIDRMDDPGLRGTHSKAEEVEALSRKTRMGRPWQRKTEHGHKGHIDRKHGHAVRTIETRAIKAMIAGRPWK